MYRVREYAEPLSRESLRNLREWPRGSDSQRRPHMMSNEYGRLRYLLGRYCRGEVDGLSVLLTGQRGAGKTTLAKLAIEAAMRDSEHLIPLPVFLHGPTMIDQLARAKSPDASENGDSPKSETSREPQKGPMSIAAIIGAALPQGGEAAPGADSAKDGDKEASRTSKEETEQRDADKKTKEQAQIKDGAFRVILTELYRCLARATYDAWLNAVDESPDARRGRHELLELRVHLDATLDRPTDVETLRSIWERAGFLHSGVVFYLSPVKDDGLRGSRNLPVPAIAGDTRDQGLREILALSACADSFSVILGKPKERLRRAVSAERERQYNMKISSPQKEGAKSGEESKGSPKTTAEKIAPTALGIVAGGLAYAGSKEPTATAVGLAVGLVVWLASLLSVSYNVRRLVSKKLDRELDLEVDWSPERIERDLPILLKRVKDAGFAPIFIVDELDKISGPENKLDKFLHLAKHIVTDYGAFLFLTDRTYYEELLGSETAPLTIGGPSQPTGGNDERARAQNEAANNNQQSATLSESYARTFYTHRIFLNYSPDDYRTYLFRLVDDSSWALEDRRRNRLGLLAWGTILVYRSRMVPSQFNRRLIALLDDKTGAFSKEYRDPALPLNRYQHEIVMQLAVEVIASRREVQDRMRDVIIGQYVYDTLYFLNYLHEQGRARNVGEGQPEEWFAVTRDRLKQYLRYRAEDGSARSSAANDRYASLTNDVVDFLFLRVLREYIEVLCHPEIHLAQYLSVHVSQLRARQNEIGRTPYEDPDLSSPVHDPDLWSALRLAIDLSPLVKM